jgi:hypothetical protein
MDKPSTATPLAIATAIATINASRAKALAELRKSRNKTKDS